MRPDKRLAEQLRRRKERKAVEDGVELMDYLEMECRASGGQALPGLILLDLNMPRLDGLRAAQEIRKLLPTVPIVLHTLYGTAEVERAAHKHGIRRLVEKAKTGALVSAVEELLSAEAASQPSATSDETSEILAPPIASPTSDVAVTAAQIPGPGHLATAAEQ